MTRSKISALSSASFPKSFRSKAGDKLSITAGDAFLLYVKFFGYQATLSHTPAEMKENISKLWEEYELLSSKAGAELVEDPEDVPQKNFLGRLIPGIVPQKQKIAFIHEKNPENSSWTYGHELGRMHLEQTYPDQVQTFHWDNVIPDVNGLQAIDEAVAKGCTLIFTTTPRLIEASLQAAVKYPDIKILNCSVNNSYYSIRTYYGRMYEAKVPGRRPGRRHVSHRSHRLHRGLSHLRLHRQCQRLCHRRPDDQSQGADSPGMVPDFGLGQAPYAGKSRHKNHLRTGDDHTGNPHQRVWSLRH